MPAAVNRTALNRTALAALTCAALLTPVLTGCSGSDTGVGVAPTTTPMPTAAQDPGDRDSEKAALALARTTWAGRGGPDYDLVVAGSCFCVDNVAVTVRVRGGKGTVAKVEPAVPQEPGQTPTETPTVTPTAPERTPTTVEALLDLVAAELADSDKVTVTYTPDGVPKEIRADRIENAVDDEMYWTIRYTAR